MSHSKIAEKSSGDKKQQIKTNVQVPLIIEPRWQLVLNLNLALHRYITYPSGFECQFRGLQRVREDLANSGLSLSSSQKSVFCHFCKKSVSVSELAQELCQGTNIDEQHHKLSPECPLFTQETENIPLEPTNCVQYKYEVCRLFSLLSIKWKYCVSVYDLAHHGFYYAGPDDNVRCVFCKLEVRGWEPNDTARGEHLRWNPKCAFINDQDVGNILIGQELSRFTPDGVVLNKLLGLSKNVEKYKHLLTIICPRNKISLETLAIVEVELQKYPNRSSYQDRLKTFSEWPKALAQKPADLAKAGFFYTGQGDRVCCFHCGVGLKDWNCDDEPWKEHVGWSPGCKFAMMVKGMPSIQKLLFPSKSVPQEIFHPKTIEGHLCRSCLKKDANAVNLPCGHVERCLDCCKSHSCSKCSQLILAYLKMYLN